MEAWYKLTVCYYAVLSRGGGEGPDGAAVVVVTGAFVEVPETATQ